MKYDWKIQESCDGEHYFVFHQLDEKGNRVYLNSTSRLVDNIFYFKNKELARNAANNFTQQFEEPMTDTELYVEMSKRSGLKVGDKVKILRQFKLNEMGANAIWDKDMFKLVGTEGIITEVSHNQNYCIGGNYYYWPFYCLELLESYVEPIKIKLNDTYVAVVTKDGVTVGCQKFSHDKVTELLEAINKINNTK